MKKNKNYLKLISLNMERNKHLRLIIPFLKKEKADVICLQEIMHPTAKKLAKRFRYHLAFAPMTRYSSKKEGINDEVMGVAILSRTKPLSSKKYFYYGNASHIPTYSHTHQISDTTLYRVLLTVTIARGKERYTIGTTHFTWTPNGETSAKQVKDLRSLFRVLTTIPEIMFCGDFNAPRGRKIFQTIAKRYTDHIPKRYTQSLDPKLHHRNDLNYMVDGLFSTMHYQTRTVSLVTGVSDHRAIRALVSRNK